MVAESYIFALRKHSITDLIPRIHLLNLKPNVYENKKITSLLFLYSWCFLHLLAVKPREYTYEANICISGKFDKP